MTNTAKGQYLDFPSFFPCFAAMAMERTMFLLAGLALLSGE